MYLIHLSTIAIQKHDYALRSFPLITTLLFYGSLPVSALSEPTHSAPVREPTHSAPVREPTHSAPFREPTHSALFRESTQSAPFREPTQSVPEPAPFRGPMQSAPEPAPFREPTQSAPEPTPFWEPTQSAPEPAPPREPTESAPEPAPLRDPLVRLADSKRRRRGARASHCSVLSQGWISNSDLGRASAGTGEPKKTRLRLFRLRFVCLDLFV